ncbi:restriction endonuclease subunit S [Methylobacillus sp.]|uniref:restriction endonuclease subunit S n=1 Tax=Methylobacillus sp. TaxID=56818 RepID=UPI0012CE3588|nr:restriction endonuclease subunit S [Methylobacillus sp.]MPS47977.1 restriction endonuclease subunit S [Methylobacillus sp.]
MDKQGKKALVPRLRFPEFRNAEGWDARELKNACEVNPPNSGIPETFVYIDLESVEAGELKLRKVINRTDAPSRAQRVLRYGDVIFQIVRPYQRNNLLFKYKEDIPFVASTGYAQLRAIDSVDFLFQAVHADDFVERVIAKCTGSSYPAINSSDLADIYIALPSKAEQQTIADCLTSLDEVIAAENQKLETLKTYKKGLMQQLFPREGETVPRLRFPEFRETGEWCEKPLSKVCNVLQGYGFPEVLQGKSEGKYPFCKVSDISRAVAEKGGVLDEATNYVGDDELLKLKAKPVPKGATVFAKIGEALRLNRRAYVQKACLIDNNATGLKAIDGIADDYFVYLLSQLIDLNRHCGGAVPSVNKTTLEEIEVVVPGLDEQKRIAENLSSLDDLITTQSQKIDALKNHKKGLMQQLFPVLDEVPA